MEWLLSPWVVEGTLVSDAGRAEDFVGLREDGKVIALHLIKWALDDDNEDKNIELSLDNIRWEADLQLLLMSILYRYSYPKMKITLLCISEMQL